MKLYSLHAAVFFISLSFHTNVLDAVILAKAILRHAVVKVDEEDVAQSAIFSKEWVSYRRSPRHFLLPV